MSATRALAAGERAQIEARPRPAAASPLAAAASGVSLEVTTPADAASPPVDAERVRQIKAALKDGSYPLVPTKIADAMIAAQVSLSLPEGS
ncbi:MAG: flagellar biosynthesis anti-sigma factor FlgM [Porphyrobacter sp.]|nr:flagellar biosynthesis anti-sigma factor FlgM [Porphyrobacter sp.]